MTTYTATRVFYLEVADDLLPFTKTPKKGFNTYKMQDGLYFNTKARISGAQALQYQYAQMVKLQIEELLAAESRKLQSIWYKGIPTYFNRRAYGMYFRKHKYPPGKRPRKFAKQSGRFRRKRGTFARNMETGPFIGPRSYLKETEGHRISSRYTNRRQFPGRTRTGQLRRALIVTDMSPGGCTLLVKPCYAETGGKIDYVNILMKGAHSRIGHPYIPEFDRRIKMPNRVWRGIKSTYWMDWQRHFEVYVNQANDRIHAKVTELFLKLKILEQNDLALIRRGSRKEKKITAIEAERKSRKAKTGPIVPDSPYNRTRDGKYWAPGSYKVDPQVYVNKSGPFNPYNPFTQNPPFKPRKRI
jgi:hypothetical protein